jgi:hypothetical protein
MTAGSLKNIPTPVLQIGKKSGKDVIFKVEAINRFGFA